MKKTFFSMVVLGICLASFSLLFGAPVDMKRVEVAYLFEEGKGKVTKDVSVNKRNGTLEGGVKYGPGKYGRGLVYDGKDGNLIVKGYHGIGGRDPRTVLYWFKSASARDHSWVKWGSGEQTMKYYVRGHLDGAKCYLRVENAGGNNWGDVDVCDGKWHHHAVVFPNKAKDVQDHNTYVDGKLNGKAGAANPMDTDNKAQEVVMGAKLLHHTFMHGSFDEVAIFNVALTDKQIQLIMKQGLASALAIEPGDKLSTNWAAIKAVY
ncbi:hypothetical protein CMK12_17910 [Candidatus Poribacteria bacterium]|jgi:hypothetical protein|nr:hypothetical protein [Candidatus Poribacteria bacterium]MDP6595425.1 hypothetical protein [Candidatus Poribacteria bacterium]MDP6750923.1 hypothetical protein [Candidatus Poribacteria bacterium]MDP6995253.1 hypothetical protein [Candidatus Poribacteria bacterium]MDP7279210.1 hypothetical protein [Candidatus Poribacteria bacterium]